MSKITISAEERALMNAFLEQHPHADLVNTYLCFLGSRLKVAPVLFLKDKTIYRDARAILDDLEQQGKLWRETQIKVSSGSKRDVNEETTRVYICPFSGKVFGNNTHPNPQDAIYDWVSKCPENNEMIGGLKAKRFFVSEDPEVIKGYLKEDSEKPIIKTVYSSAITGKLFNSKEAVIQDFKASFLKPISLVEVPNQNRYKIHADLLHILQTELVEEKIEIFVEALSEFEEFAPFLEQWVGSEEE